MKAYQLDQFGSIDGIAVHERPTPAPGPGQVLVRVRAASLNQRDQMIVHQRYLSQPRQGVIPLSDGAGEVVAVGAGATRAQLGDRVTSTYFRGWIDGEISPAYRARQYGSELDGALAEYWLVDDESIVQLPRHLSFEEGATLTCAGVTAWSALTGPRPVRPGDSVLTIGTGGVALFTVQLAKLFGARVIVVTSSDRKAAELRKLGADEVVSYAADPAWDAAVRELTSGRGVDHVVETVGPATLARSLRATRYGGHLAFAGAFSGEPIEAISLLSGNVTIVPLAVGSRAAFEAMNRAISAHQLHPVVDKVFPFAEAKAAYRRLEARQQIGKVVIAGA